MTTARSVRVADQIRRILADLVREAGDPRLGFVTVTAVRLTPDLKCARVFFTSLDDVDRPGTLRVLGRAAAFLRRELARRAGLRFTPELRFEYDAAVEGGLRIERILGELHPDDREGEDAPPDATGLDE